PGRGDLVLAGVKGVAESVAQLDVLVERVLEPQGPDGGVGAVAILRGEAVEVRALHRSRPVPEIRQAIVGDIVLVLVEEARGGDGGGGGPPPRTGGDGHA